MTESIDLLATEILDTSKAIVCLVDSALVDGRITGRHPALPAPPGATEAVLLVGDNLVRIPLDRPGCSCATADCLADEPCVDLALEGVELTAADVILDGPEVWALVARDTLRQAEHLVGLASEALEVAIRRARRRRQFGVSIGTNQSVAFALAACAARVAAARALLADVARADPAVDAVNAVWRHAANLARETTALAIHLHGTYGLTRGCPAEHLYRQAALHTAREPASPTRKE
jgi:alkylation response protein AidB-like acyl-CoA dehydrogenase